METWATSARSSSTRTPPAAWRMPGGSGQRRHELMAQNVRCIGESRQKVIVGKLWIGAQDLAGRHPVREAADQDPHRNTGTLDARIAMVQILRDGDMVLPADTAHRSLLSAPTLPRRHGRSLEDQRDDAGGAIPALPRPMQI